MLYLDTIEQWNILSDVQAGILIKALLKYGKTGERLTSEDNALSMAFSFISAQFDRDAEKYALACEKRSKYMKEKWENKKSTIVDHSQANNTNTNTNKNKKRKRNTNTSIISGQSPPPSLPKEFQKPSLDAVKAYCIERKNNIDAENFCDYYESIGWQVGNKPMKDWKAAVRRWEKTEYNKSSNTSTEPELAKGEDGFYYDKNGDRYI